MKFLLGLSIGFLLVTTGASLKCEVCMGSGNSCSGPMETCDNDTCAISVSETTVGGMQAQIIAKSCESSNICKDRTQLLNFGQGQELRTGIACCVGDACKTVTPQVPPRINQPNGKQCPACYSLLSGVCNPNETVDCVGPQNDCLEMAVTVSYGTVIINVVQKGCATKGFCDGLKLGETTVSGFYSRVTKAECVPASRPE
ncbi:phospholipase A2 inhibitor and Ly6/PLAUR domain-containing protein-like isoform X1 [Lacerta agilis]|uniref:phospholipase A2 inhibitor and Ly6/PLAUR domain-containing protein-like isoform X1 n=2 Tax=Lacerta agilis TaxID=80427 RepID=UPI001419B1E5|nr:phospholipase A2 inhibitor and Ly6/PLAUR domain-containing protein-like isoform X1 [Lacerta agilis]